MKLADMIQGMTALIIFLTLVVIIESVVIIVIMN